LYIINEDKNPTRRARLLSRWHDPILSQQREQLRQYQWAWIEDKLANCQEKWLFVAGHYPVYSAGPHGVSKVLSAKLKPMLDKYLVDAYFSGHV
jgi:tartrate-resistant acid phosphatase type 5